MLLTMPSQRSQHLVGINAFFVYITPAAHLKVVPLLQCTCLHWYVLLRKQIIFAVCGLLNLRVASFVTSIGVVENHHYKYLVHKIIDSRSKVTLTFPMIYLW